MTPSPFPPRARLRPATHLFRAAAAHLYRATLTGKPEPEAVARGLFGIDEPTKLVLRASSTQAMTTATGWAAEIAQNAVRDFINSITSMSAAAEVISRGLQVDLGNWAELRIPGRVLNATNAGTWVAEGQPIPVRMMTFIGGAVLRTRKLVVIATFTSEIAKSSLIEDVVKQTMSEAAAIALDAALLGGQPDDGAFPQGVLHGVTAQTPTPGGGMNALAGDIKKLFVELNKNFAGREAILIAASDLLPSLKILPGPQFDYTVIGSSALPDGTIIALEPSSFVCGIDPVPEFAISQNAALHMEDTTPGSPTSVPAKSMFQTDSLALRMVLRIAFGMRANGHAQYIANATW
jgi:hypothetical protein